MAGIARTLSKLGICSRSDAIRSVRAGRVSVNGRVVRDPETPYPVAGRIEIDDVSRYGFHARTSRPVPTNKFLDAVIQLGTHETSRLTVQAIQGSDAEDKHFCGFRIGEPDLIWRKFVNALYEGHTHNDLNQATRFLP